MGTNGKAAHQNYQTGPATTVAFDEADVQAEFSKIFNEVFQPKPPTNLPPLQDEALDPAAEPAAISTDAGAPPSSSGDAGAENSDTLTAAVDADESGGPAREEDAPAEESPAAAEPTGGEPAGPDGVQDAEDADIDPADLPLTPVPEILPEGAATGVPVLVGGEDLLASTANLVSYVGPDGQPREVLLAHLNEEAEAKVLEALSVTEQKLVPAQVEKDLTGRLPLDDAHKLHELVGQSAKSVNGNLKKGQAISNVTKGHYNKALAAVTALQNDPTLTPADQAMLAHYADQLAAVKDRIDNPGAQPYLAGGKIPMTEAYMHTGTATVTDFVPESPTPPAPGTYAAARRTASRIAASLDADSGTTSWDGVARTPASGVEYTVDLGEGWSAVYRPYGENDPSTTEYSMRGQLEIHAPPGSGHRKELVDNLGKLHVSNKPMTAAEGEWTYLAHNIAVQGLDKKSAVKNALAQAQHMEDLAHQELVHNAAEKIVNSNLDEAGLAKYVARLQLEAAHRVLPMKVRAVRDAVAHTAGFADGAALAASAGYQPTPSASGGWLAWSRFDVTGNPEALNASWAGKRLVHSVGKGNLNHLFALGALASTERRSVMGVTQGVGMSEGSDKLSGGANSVFLRVKSDVPKADTAARLVWDNPSVLMARTDYYGYNGDHFGVVNPMNHNTMSGKTSDPHKIAGFDAHNNEVCFRNGIDLYGAEAPSRILCTSEKQRSDLLAMFAKQGRTHLGGKPVESVVQYHTHS